MSNQSWTEWKDGTLIFQSKLWSKFLWRSSSVQSQRRRSHHFGRWPLASQEDEKKVLWNFLLFLFFCFDILQRGQSSPTYESVVGKRMYVRVWVLVCLCTSVSEFVSVYVRVCLWEWVRLCTSVWVWESVRVHSQRRKRLSSSVPKKISLSRRQTSNMFFCRTVIWRNYWKWIVLALGT